MGVRTTVASGRGHLVARERELDHLLVARRDAGEGRGGIVLIGGEAGVGKSRLLREFRAMLRGGRAACAFARCVEFVQVPLAPLRESLQGLAREAPAIVRADPGAQRLIGRLTFERSGAVSSEQPPGWLFETVDGTFARLAQRRTIVFFIEDLHWADRSTLALLAYLADRIAQRRLLVAATYRSDEVRAGHPQLAEFATLLAKDSVVNVGLSRLDASDTRQLIDGALPHPGALEASVIADIVRRSQGNPFFAEELVKSALDHPDGARVELPLSIRAALLARVALLRDDERQTLSLAAALGQRFSLARLASVSREPEEHIVATLEHAQRLNLLSDEREMGGELAFRHALTQEVLYGELLQERVRPLHERIGQELESRADRDAVIVELAHHWWCAGDSERAAHYCEEAGDLAKALSAAADAAFYYERALQSRRGDVAAEARLEHKIGSALGLLGRPTLGTPRLRRAAQLYLDSGDYEGFARNAVALGVQLYNSGDITAAMACFGNAIAIAGQRASTETMDHLRSRMAFGCVAALDFEAALHFASEVRHGSGDPATENRCSQALFKAYAMQGRVDLWRPEIDRALASAKRMDDSGLTLKNTHAQVGLDAMALGDAELAQAHFECALARRQEGHSFGDALILSGSVLEHVLRGEFAGARRTLQQAQAFPHEEYATRVHVLLGQLALGICTGDDGLLRCDEAEAFLDRGMSGGMKLVIGLVGGPYAWSLALRGDLERTRFWTARIARVLATPHRFAFAFLAVSQYGSPRDVGTLAHVLATADDRSQDPVTPALRALYNAYAMTRGILEGDAHLSALRAATGFEAIGWPWFAARAAEVAGEQDEALGAYRRLGAVGDIRRLETPMTDDAGMRVLSPREREVAHLVARAKTNDEIAQTLGISRRTVEKHVSSVLEKLSFSSRAQLGLFLTEKK